MHARKLYLLRETGMLRVNSAHRRIQFVQLKAIPHLSFALFCTSSPLFSQSIHPSLLRVSTSPFHIVSTVSARTLPSFSVLVSLEILSGRMQPAPQRADLGGARMAFFWAKLPKSPISLMFERYCNLQFGNALEKGTTFRYVYKSQIGDMVTYPL